MVLLAHLARSVPRLFQSSPQCTDRRTLIEYIVVCCCACVALVSACALPLVMDCNTHCDSKGKSKPGTTHHFAAFIILPGLSLSLLARAPRGFVVKFMAQNWEFCVCDGHWNFRGIRGLGTDGAVGLEGCFSFFTFQLRRNTGPGHRHKYSWD